MKEAELRQQATCAHCQRKIGESRRPMFYTVTIARHGIDLAAVRRQQGLAMMLGWGVGSGFIANVMGPDEEMTIPLMETGTITICEDCSTNNVCVSQLAEYVNSVRITDQQIKSEIR